ncbi:hypothetical protein [Mycolicibacterium komossense]|uniref:hypothetical protein n=1 Tax=Mycolicibacterium komossense TaxID=1779 RepID=UPI0021F35EF3|nr:hypothetical protein [Mycolicibacterium komossense]
MTAGKENVAIFNPLVLPLPSWHPDGPDGAVDGYRIPFVFPDDRTSGRQPNRAAYLRVYPTEHGWRASLRNCQDHAETAEQARAFAGAWIRAAEVLENVATAEAARAAADDGIVDAEIVEDDEDQDDGDQLPAGAESMHICVEGCSEDAHIATDWTTR